MRTQSPPHSGSKQLNGFTNQLDRFIEPSPLFTTGSTNSLQRARKPTHIDGFYVHPLETFIGIALFMGSAVLMGLVLGTFHVATMIIAYLAFIQVNTINHTYVNLPYFPFKTLS